MESAVSPFELKPAEPSRTARPLVSLRTCTALSSLPPVFISTTEQYTSMPQSSIPTLQLERQDRSPKHRTRRKPRAYDRPRPTYYVPRYDQGGKSQGYGWGYTSFPGEISI
jgi:hypothetical protein